MTKPSIVAKCACRHLVHDTRATEPLLDIEMDLVDDVVGPDEVDDTGLVASESA